MARVLHLISSNQRRGAETFGVELAADLRGRGHEVEVIAVAQSATGPFHNVEIAGRHRADPAGFARIVREARDRDLLVSFGSVSLQVAAVAGAIARRPFVYRNIGDPAVWQTVRGARWRVGLPLRRATAIVAVFPGARDELIRRNSIDPSRVRVIPRGVPADRFPVATEDARAAARTQLGLDPGRPWALYVGSLSAEKDPELAVTAVAAHPNAGLIICGDGPLADTIRRQTALPAERLRLLGPVDDVRPPLAAADLLILTSRTEGIAGAAIEAGLTGLPVVSSRVGGMPYLIEDGATGVLVSPGDRAGFTAALTTALDGADRLGLAAATRCRAEFSMEVVGAAWDRLVSEVAAAGHR